ncbi:MAG: hypothetical protein PHO01_11670 [Desulfotomaculaceae bacterium]|nr:hypothetical protein [Desulfotomaculaceae bacterium]
MYQKVKLIIILVGFFLFLFQITHVGGQGETVSIKELMPLVKIKIPNMKLKGKPVGNSNNGITEVTANYVSATKTVRINIVDYGKTTANGGSPGIFGLLHPPHSQIIRSDINGYTCEQTYYPDKKSSYLKFYVGSFGIYVNGDGIDDAEELQEIARKINVKQIEALAATKIAK